MKKTLTILLLLICVTTSFGQSYQRKPMLGQLPNWANPNSRGTDKNLVGCWLFNEGSGNKVFDLSGNNNHSTSFAGTPTWVGEGIDFGDEASGDSIILPNNFGYDDLTVVIGVRVNLPAGPDDNVCFFGMTNDDVTDRFMLALVDAAAGGWLQIYDDIDNRGTAIVATSGAFSQGWNPSTVISYVIGKTGGRQIYRDGILVGSEAYYTTGPIDVSVAANCTTISGYRSLGSMSDAANSIIKFVFIFNRALNHSEIALLHAQPFCFMEPSWNWVLYGGISVPTGAGQVIYIN